MSALPDDVRAQVEAEVGALPAEVTPYAVLASHASTLSSPAARAVGALVPPRERKRIPEIKHRRHLYATADPRPDALRAAEGRRRWPLLWERLGGDPRPPATQSTAQAEAETWARTGFMPGHERFVDRLGAMLAEEEEMREWEETRANRGRERRLEQEGEEFDESDDEEGGEEAAEAPAAPPAGGLPGAPVSAPSGADDQVAVEEAFERALLELYLDGLDTLDYDEVDFTPAYDPIAARDAEDAWFDDEAPSTAAPGGGKHWAGNGAGSGPKATENGQGEYDY